MQKKSNTKQALWIAIGNLFSTSVALVSAMILSRYFNKEDYGTYKQVIYIYSTTQIVFTLGLPRCFSYFLPQIPLEEGKQTIKKITNILYIMGGIFSLILFLGAPIIADWFKNEKLIEALRIYSPVALFLLPTMGLEGILATYRKSEYTALYNATTRLLMLVCIVLPVIIFKGTYLMALWGFVISSFLTFILAINLRNIPFKGTSNNISSIKYKDIWNYSVPLMLASIWGALLNSTDQFFISRYYGTEAFANFSNGAIQLPFVGMVTSSVSTVITPVFTKEIYNHNYTNVVELWQRSTIKSSKILFPLIVFFLFFATPLMILMYGVEYSDSAIYFQIKQMASFFQIITSVNILLAFGLTKFYSKVHMLAFLILIPVEYIVCKTIDSPYAVTAVHVLAIILITYVFLLNVSHKLQRQLQSFIPIKDLSKLLITSITSGIFSSYIIIALEISNNIIKLALGSMIFFICYIILGFSFKLGYKEIFISIIPKQLRAKIKH